MPPHFLFLALFPVQFCSFEFFLSVSVIACGMLG